jgi:predicted dehydrogenase
MIKLGIVGAGYIAKEHCKVIAGTKFFSVCGIISKSGDRASALASEFKIPFSGSSISEMVEKCRPEALMLLVPVEQMFIVLNECLQYQLPIFIEKPMGLDIYQATDLCDKIEKAEIPVVVGYNRRFYSVFQKGIDIIRKHGKLFGVSIEGHERFWKVRQSGEFSEKILDNWIFANATHTIDLLRFFGGDPIKVHCIQKSMFEKNGDQFAMVCEFESGALGEYCAHWYSPGGWKVVLYGDGVTVEFKPLEKGVWIDKSFTVHEINPDPEDIKFKPGFFRQLQSFAKSIETGSFDFPLCLASDALKTMHLANALREEKSLNEIPK